jgi:hypothetical protein
MRRLFTLYTLSILAVVLIAGGCGSTDKALRSGHYNKAIQKAVKKLRRNPEKTKNVKVLEEAYAKANRRDLDRISFLKKEGRPDIWVEVHNRYKDINYRQGLVQPLLPLRGANFDMTRYDSEMIQAKKKAAEYLYAHGVELMKKNDRGSARQAYNEFKQVKSYYPNFKDVDQQLTRALDLGTNKVLVKMANHTGVPLPPNFERDLTKMSVHELNRQWISYHNKKQNGVFYDYEIIVSMKLIDVAPEQLKEVRYKEEAEVEDGWEYQLDANGNVMKDTAGNDIKIPKTKIITAWVVETQQTKVARISGSVDYWDKRANQMIRSFPVTADGIFEHFSAMANGELAALRPETRAKLQNERIPFPPDFDLLMLAGVTLKPMVKDIIWDNKNLVKY